MGMLTIDDVRSVVPKNFKHNINQEFVDVLNECGGDAEVARIFRENFISYNSVLQSGKYKMEDYINAVRFVSYKLLNKSNAESWRLTFPIRHKKLLEKKVDDISPYVSAYTKNKLVTEILNQSLTPLYVLNGHMGQDALNTLYTVMMNPRTSDRNKINACTAILEAVQQPESAKINIALDIKGNDLLNSMHESLRELTQMQLNNMQKGSLTAQQIMEASIIDVEVDD